MLRNFKSELKRCAGQKRLKRKQRFALLNNANFFSFYECSNFDFYTKRSGRLEFSYKAGSLFYRSNENK